MLLFCWYFIVRRRKIGWGGLWELFVFIENVKNYEGVSFGGFLEWILYEKVVISFLYCCDKIEL